MIIVLATDLPSMNHDFSQLVLKLMLGLGGDGGVGDWDF